MPDLFAATSDRPVICFVDDDQDELDRFTAAMKDDFKCVTGLHYEDCKKVLKKQGLRPQLWVLDLFFPKDGITNSRDQITTMNEKYAKLESEILDYKAYLESIGQGSDGGLELLERCKTDYNVPVVMFTRKGALQDAIKCIDNKATAVLKKPMPPDSPDEPNEMNDMKKRFDDAMMSARPYLTFKFHEYMAANSFWIRYKSKFSFVGGLATAAVLRWLFGLIG